jgi:hypothetical protein
VHEGGWQGELQGGEARDLDLSRDRIGEELREKTYDNSGEENESCNEPRGYEVHHDNTRLRVAMSDSMRRDMRVYVVLICRA